MKTEETEEYTLTYDESMRGVLAAYKLLLAWYKKTGHFSGESIHQSHNICTDAPELLTEIAEKAFQFKQDWK